MRERLERLAAGLVLLWILYATASWVAQVTADVAYRRGVAP